ncbi:hypothetical protein CY34DRAFT_803637 [Suillus luteus UH-Slu-Lm8-n1]|uniref:Uncharacterized protein n=1 Tax=Suillus luteus UH-Slu-Lm8-n1 TaxID=930992 RepID=A0A0D0B0U1_9AGAM|nr:hypothetical protein CY34DRAFT_803637 [Suillus luteus UH-Slu-Lm8-n1]
MLDNKLYVRISYKAPLIAIPQVLERPSRCILLGLFHCHPAVHDGEKEKLLTQSMF